MKEARMPTTPSTKQFYLTPEAIATKCENAKQWGARWSAKCPAHKDKTASLSIDKGRKATIVHCHAGCTTRMVLDALELKMEMLYYDYDPHSNTNPHSTTSLKLAAMMRARTPYSQRELAPARTLEDVLWPVIEATPQVWVWVRLRWSDWLSLPFEEAMKKHWVVTDAIAADLMVNDIDAGYDYTLDAKRRLRDRLEAEWEQTQPVTGS